MVIFILAIQAAVLFAASNLFSLNLLFDIGKTPLTILIVLSSLIFVAINMLPTVKKRASLRIMVLEGGTRLLTVFSISTVASVIWLLVTIFAFDLTAKQILINSAIVFAAELVVFWNGIIRVYFTSLQLGIKWRVLGLLFGMIPIANLVLLVKIIHVCNAEFHYEQDKADLDAIRSESSICATKYPILMVHGVFFRDLRFYNYWGRIPSALKKNGATLFYGQQESAASVEDAGKELAARIKQIVEETGCEKVNILAHSKGGMDARYAVSQCAADKYTASLTTLGTPHYGCEFCDALLNSVSEKLLDSVSRKYNRTLKLMGDKNPDFKSAVWDLTAQKCAEINARTPDVEGVYYQSVGSKSIKATSGKFPLNLSYQLIKKYDGENDGLVSIESMKWGENFVELTPTGKRGITHGDIIDLNKENIKGFDVREFYVNLVADLKNKGY